MTFLRHIVVGILLWESKIIVRKYKPFVIAVTGSVGKTSTKNAIYDVLKDHKGYVRKSEKSFNSEIGLPLTIIGVPNGWRSASQWLYNMFAGLKLILVPSKYPDCLILEIGADHPGDIKRTVKWLKPDIAVLTRISRTPVHVEFFKSPEEVFEEKVALATAVKDGGTVVLYADDEKMLTIADIVKNATQADPKNARNVSIFTYGFNEKATMRAGNIQVVYEHEKPTGFTFDAYLDGTPSQAVVKGILGETYVYPLIAAASVARICGVEVGSIVRLLEEYNPPKGRMNLIPGKNDSTLIDDTYNSSPDAVISALQTLKSLQTDGSKIAVLGDMLELGKFASQEHRRVGAEAVKCVDILVTVGQRSRLTAEEAVKSGMTNADVISFDDSTSAADYLVNLIKPHDIILIKGSQGIRTERIAAVLMRDHTKAGELLVRQEKEWLEKV